MHDPRVLLDPATDAVRRLARRGFALDLTALEKLLAAPQRRDPPRRRGPRGVQADGHSVRSASPDERPALVERARELKTVVADAEAEARELDAQLQDLLLGVPNLPADDVPDGSSEDDAELVRSWGEPPAFDFTPRDHVDLGEQLGILDLPRATKLSGPRFAVLRGQGAKLERALARYFLDLAEEHGYTEFSVPTLVNRETMTGTGQLPKFESDLFKTGVADRELFLIPTAEVPLTNLHARETLAVDDLPLAYTAHTPCFRSEAGSYGRDTRGLIRMHEFSKVELVRIVDSATSRDELELLVTHAEAVLQGLGLAYRVVKLAAGDLGFSSHAHLRPRGVAAGAAEVPRDRVGVGLRDVPGPARGDPDAGGGRQPRVRGHAEQLGPADRAHAGGDPGAGAAGRRVGADPRGAGAVHRVRRPQAGLIARSPVRMPHRCGFGTGSVIMRAFVALIPPAAVLAELAAALAPVQAAHPDLRWTPAGQWHLTLAFLGEIDGDALDEGVLPDLTARLARAARRHPPPELALSGAGRFGDRVLWTRVRGELRRARRVGRCGRPALRHRRSTTGPTARTSRSPGPGPAPTCARPSTPCAISPARRGPPTRCTSSAAGWVPGRAGRRRTR